MVLIPPTLRGLSRGACCTLFEGCPSWWCLFAAFNHVVFASAIVSLSCYILFVSGELIAVVLLVFSLSLIFHSVNWMANIIPTHSKHPGHTTSKRGQTCTTITHPGCEHHAMEPVRALQTPSVSQWRKGVPAHDGTAQDTLLTHGTIDHALQRLLFVLDDTHLCTLRLHGTNRSCTRTNGH